ncbi:hypothetical protein FGO68_gene2054 [Halteria grandinella]|uniref:Uncharacterized protein n=1 Tax=Halteria grandinella TaxID=5974 RepID=A0A8J8P5H7_HALGN|nr:hypothetical protein FGO68_gene2054 [Halteria grandinella]
MRNLLFGGDDSVSTIPSQPRPPQSNFYPSPSQDLHLVSPLQAQAQAILMNHKAQTLHSGPDPLQSMNEIESKINNKLQEIESMFIHNKGGEAMEENIMNIVNQQPADAKQGNAQAGQKGAQQKPPQGKNGRQPSSATSDRKQQAIQKVVRQHSQVKQQAPQIPTWKALPSKPAQQEISKPKVLSSANAVPLPDPIPSPRHQLSKPISTNSTPQLKLPPKNQPVKPPHLNADLPPPDSTPNLDISSSDNFQDNTYAFQLEKQLQQKSSEIIRLKKKITTLEKQLDAKKQEQEKNQNLQSALNKEGVTDTNTDERRIMILKAQNGQLTRSNAHMSDVIRSMKKSMHECDNILGELAQMCRNVENNGLNIQLKIPEILQTATSLQKRLKNTVRQEQKDFNQKRFEEDNPFYIQNQKAGVQGGTRFENDDEEGNGGVRQDHFELNREKIFATEQKLSMLLENSLDLYMRCFQKNKVPNTNQFLRLCEDLRQGIESLLLLGIGLNPQQTPTPFAEATKTKQQAFKDYIEKKLCAKIELDKHVLTRKLDVEECRVLTRDLKRQLSEVLTWQQNRKQEKQQVFAHLYEKVQSNELAYIAEIFLKHTQINLLRASYSKLFQLMNALKQWFRQKVQGTVLGPLRGEVYERFLDLDIIMDECENKTGDIQGGQVKLWSVMRMHGPEIRFNLEKILSGNPEFGVGDTQLDEIGREFEERVTEAKEMIMLWTGNGAKEDSEDEDGQKKGAKPEWKM